MLYDTQKLRHLKTIMRLESALYLLEAHHPYRMGRLYTQACIEDWEQARANYILSQEQDIPLFKDPLGCDDWVRPSEMDLHAISIADPEEKDILVKYLGQQYDMGVEVCMVYGVPEENDKCLPGGLEAPTDISYVVYERDLGVAIFYGLFHRESQDPETDVVLLYARPDRLSLLDKAYQQAHDLWQEQERLRKILAL